MFIPLDGENILCLANVVAICKNGDKTEILRRGGRREISVFTPSTLAKRKEAFSAKALYRRTKSR